MSPLENNLTAVDIFLGANIDDLDHIGIMLDHLHGIPTALQRLQQGVKLADATGHAGKDTI